MAAVSVPLSVADYNLGILEKSGYIRRHREVSRGIELLNENIGRVTRQLVPVIGTIAAGEPIPVPAAVLLEYHRFCRILSKFLRKYWRGKTEVYAL